MTSPGSCVRLTRRQWLRLSLWFCLVGLLVAVAWCGDRVEAQDLALSDFDDTGVATDVLALMTKGVDGDHIYRSSASSPATGSLVSGELGLGDADVPICRIRVQEQGNTVRIHDCEPFSLSTYFGAGGAGSDLTLRVQSGSGTGTGTIDTARLGAGYVAFDMDADGRDVLVGLPVGTSYIIALVRDLPVDPTQVTGVGATADDHDSVTVTWNAHTDADGYVVQWDTDASFGSPAEAAITSGTTVSYHITGLSEDTTYYVRVYATQTGANDGTPSLSVSATTELQPPGPVSGVSLTVDSDVAITVSWTAALRADSYRVEWGTTSGTYTGSAATTATSYTITGLTYSTTYYFRVVATRTGADDGAPSTEDDATTEAAPTPGQVSGVDATANSHDSITATWNTVASTCGSALYYQVRWDQDPNFGSPQTQDLFTPPLDRYLITGLVEGAVYSVQVRAFCADLFAFHVSDGPWSVADAATTELQPPAKVIGLNATAASDTEISLSWTLAVRAGGYRIEWGTSPGSYTDSANTAALTHTVSGLSPETRYYFKVTATRAGASDGPPSDEADARTNPAPLPGQVAGVAATAVSDSEIRGPVERRRQLHRLRGPVGR